MSKQAFWNDRYASSELVWGTDANRFVAEAYGDATARGRALDLACGEGRNTIWLAERGWRATGVDYSGVAIERARKLAAHRGVDVDFVEADASSWAPEPGAYALVVIAYLQVPADEARRVWEHAVAALEPGGELFMIGHARRNLEEGTGGPQDLAVLWEPEEVAVALRELGLQVDAAEHVTREVEDAPRAAIDARVRAHRG
jgi:SAM-dependent methyltransferase